MLDKELAIMQERIRKWMNKKLEEAILLRYLIQCGYTKDTLSARKFSSGYVHFWASTHYCFIFYFYHAVESKKCMLHFNVI